MDEPSFLLILSNLLHLHNHLDPSSPSQLSISSPSSSSSAAAAAPLLFFALASVLSFATTSSPSPSSPSPPLSPSFSKPLLPTHPSRFRSLYGLSHSLYLSLLDHVRPFTSATPIPIPLDHLLLIALSRLSRGLSSRSLARSLSLPPHVVSLSTNLITRLLATRLYSLFLKPPRRFSPSSPLLNLAAGIASSPVRLRRSNGADDHLLRSSLRPFPAILLQVVADHRKVFWDACVRAPGAADPAAHLRDSRIYSRLASGDLLREPVLNVRGQAVRPYLVGDSSFPLLPFLLVPFSPQDPDRTVTADPAHAAFDAALARARAASVEPAVALLKGRWRILRNLNVGLEHAAQTVVACCVLHNMCQLAEEPEDGGRSFWHDPPECPQPARPVESERSMYYAGEGVRQVLADDLLERQQRSSGWVAGPR